MADASCSDSDHAHAGGKSGKDGQKDLIVAGSTALLNNLPLEAVENYKSALEKVNCKANQKIPMGLLVLRYALCIALIKCNSYKHIVEAVENLRELVDTGYASKLPALYLALAKAYYALNRFKKALDFIEKGLKAIQSNSKVKQHAFPGLQQTIEETGKDFLQKELLSLQKGCKTFNPPDAVCGYDQCEAISDHVVPSKEIYFTDPGFKPFFYLQCDAKCKFAYHDLCWEHLQDTDCDLKEPEDLLGTQCPSDKCTTNLNTISVIVEVSLIGSEGFDNPLSKFCLQTPLRKSVKKVHSISPSVSSNGSPVKSCGNASLGDSKSGVRPSGEAPCPAVNSSQTPPVKNVKNVKKTSTAASTVLSNHIPMHLAPWTSKDQRFFTHSSTCALNRPPTFPACNPLAATGFPILQHAPYVTPPFHPRYQVFGNANGPQVFYRPPYPRPFAPVPAQNFVYYPSPPPIPPPSTCVEVVVGSTSVLSAGTTLLVPISATGGPCHLKLPPGANRDSSTGIQSGVSLHDLGKQKPVTMSVTEDFKRSVKKLAEDFSWKEPGSTLSQSSSCHDVSNVGCPSMETNSPRVAELPPNLKLDSVERPPIKSVVEDFKRVVKQLAGESAPKVYAKKPKQVQPPCTSAESMKKVVEEFKRLVHEQAARGVPSVTDCKPAVKTSSPSLDFNMNHRNVPNFNSCATFFSSELLPLSVASTSYSHTMKDSLSSETTSDHLMTQSSTFQAKSKCSSLKEQQHHSHEPIVLPRSIIALYCTPLDDIRPEPLIIPDIETARKIVDKCRAVKFGYSDDEYVNPELQCFGHPFVASSPYVEPDEIEIVDKGHADFVFSYYQSVFDKEGIHRIEDLQEAWTSTLSECLGLPKTFTDRYTSVAEFLLSSEKFAAIDDVIGTSDLLPDMFSKAEAEIAESVKYLLFTSVSNHGHSDKFTRSFNNTWNSQIYLKTDPCTHNNSTPSSDNDDYCSDPSKEDSDGCERSDTGKDDNDNAIFSSSSSCKSSVPGINGEHKPDSKPKFVYMSDDDEEIETSLLNVDHQSVNRGTPNKISNPPVVSMKWSEKISKIGAVDQDSQTDIIIDAEKEKLLGQKEILLKEVTELKYEKTELQQRIEQMESARANHESQQSRTMKNIQESLEQKLQEKTAEAIEIQEKYARLDEELKKLKEDLKENDSQISELHSVSDKLRRTHAKEINNFVKRLQSREEEFQNLLKAKDEMYIQLWKDFCEFKTTKFNNLCNDRINVLSQLKDMMSDTLRPSKTDIKCAIEKYEEEMITVAFKTNEVNEVYTQEKEKLMGGKQINLPSVIDLPDIKNMPYPPEGAFEYLQNVLKPKQDEFGVPRNPHPQPVSKFYPSGLFTSNSLQHLSQTRESEGFQSVPSIHSSIFGQQHNETSHLWNNFTAPTQAPSVMPFDVSNTNGLHLPLHQGFGAPGSLMQPQLNLMSNRVSYQQPSQSPTVQLMGQTRSTPSPSLPFTSVNGTAFNPNTTLLSPGAIGSKASTVGAIQKPVPNTVPPNLVVKNTPPATPVVVTSASVSSQGAIPKPRVQTATAAMTPIVPLKPVVRPPGVKGLKMNESNYEKLMRNLQKMFPTRNDMELTHALKYAREKNGNTLSSLTHAEIVAKVEEILNKHAKHTSMGWEKFGQAAWGTAKLPIVEWEGSEQDECCICMTAMHAKEVYTLECKHAFHKECIRKWLLQDSVCPNCRTHSTMLDEFPPLG